MKKGEKIEAICLSSFLLASLLFIVISLTTLVNGASASENSEEKGKSRNPDTEESGAAPDPGDRAADSGWSNSIMAKVRLVPEEKALRPDAIDKLSADDIALAAKQLVDDSRNGGQPIGEVLEEILPPEYLSGLLASERDLDDFDTASQKGGTVGDSYGKLLEVAQSLIHERQQYEVFFSTVYGELCSGPEAEEAADDCPRKGRSPIAGPGDVAKPSLAAIRNSHPYALDIFFTWFKKDSSGIERGPALYSLSNGIVVGSANDWEGGAGTSRYKGGGLSPKSGNGVVVYDPETKRYYSYFHMSEVCVSTGDLVKKGCRIGSGGNSGANARKAGHGGHVHVEIFDTERDRPLTAYELRKLLFP